MITLSYLNVALVAVIWAGIWYTLGFWRSDNHMKVLLEQLIDDGVLTYQQIVMSVNRIKRKAKGLPENESKKSE